MAEIDVGLQSAPAAAGQPSSNAPVLAPASYGQGILAQVSENPFFSAVCLIRLELHRRMLTRNDRDSA